MKTCRSTWRTISAMVLVIGITERAQAGWTRIGTSGDGSKSAASVYVDFDHIKNQTARKVWVLYDYTFAQTDMQYTAPFLSVVNYYSISCVEDTTRVMQFNFFSDHMGGGTSVGSGTNENSVENAIIPGSVDELVEKVVCK